ncbi:hypothetical protein GGS21DRAFT_501728 [Xylaria nigripes]|nr:hypothetical protein GGS21DRAFT_501728 [Xylaria nigripes]
MAAFGPRVDDEGEDELSMPVFDSENEQENDVSAPTGNSEDAEQPEIFTIVTSDLIGSHLPGSSEAPSDASVSQKADFVGDAPSLLHPKMRLAVHIRSSPVTPQFTPTNPQDNQDPFTMNSRLNRTRARTAESQTPQKLPTPSALSNADVRIKTPKSKSKIRESQRISKSSTPNSTDTKSRSQDQRQVQDQGQNQDPKRRRRPAESPDSVRERYLESEPDYIPYKCEWDTSKNPNQEKLTICPAELHNIDTLRRHVYYIHADADQLVCRFSSCKTQNPPLVFESDEEFENHMEKKHFAAYLWHLGDGYQNSGTQMTKKKSNELPAYLFDKQGNQVTPSVTIQQVESELELKKRKRKLKILLDEQNENAPSEEEWMRQMLGIE